MTPDNHRSPDETAPPTSNATGSTGSRCPLCECKAIDTGDVEDRLHKEFWPEDGHPDHLGLKRALEAEHGLSLTVSKVRRHVDEHVGWSLGTGRNA